MEFHYVVKYDSDKKEWSFDDDMTDNLDGNVWSNDNGFFWPAPEYPGTEAIDADCRKSLVYCINMLPKYGEK